jgi:hypothetical protein
MSRSHDDYESMSPAERSDRQARASRVFKAMRAVREPQTTDQNQMTTDQEIIENKTLRRDIDAIIQRVKSLPGSRERSLTTTKLQEGVMWLGMDLKRINEIAPGSADNPYPNSKDPSNTKIEPTADGLKL